MDNKFLITTINEFFGTIVVLGSMIFEINSFFYLVNHKGTSKKEVFFLVGLFLFLFILDGFGTITFANIATVIEVLGIYLFYKKRFGKFNTLSSIVTAVTLSLFAEIISGALSFHINHKFSILPFSLSYIILIIILAVLLRKINVKKYLLGLNKHIVLILEIYVYITLIFISFLNLNFEKTPLSSFFSIGMLVIQIIFSVFIYRATLKIQKDKLTRQQQKILISYMNSLENTQKTLRKFKHDYQNMLNSLELSASDDTSHALLKKLEHYSKTKFNKEVLWRFNDVNNVSDPLLKSIVITKLNKVFQQGYTYHFECTQKITQLPNIDTFDLVRIIGIAYDNAIEESQLVAKKYHDNKRAEIDSMLYQSEPGEIEFVVRNRIANNQISKNDLTTANFTTKKAHQGVGLTNVKEIVRQYPQAYFKYEVRDNWFIFTLIVNKV